MIKYSYVLIFLMCIIICSCDLLKKEAEDEVRGVTVEAVDFNLDTSGYHNRYYGAYKFTNYTSLKVIIEAEVWSETNFPIPIFRKKSCSDKFVIEPHKTYTWDKAKWHCRYENNKQKLKYIAYKCEN